MLSTPRRIRSGVLAVQAGYPYRRPLRTSGPLEVLDLFAVCEMAQEGIPAGSWGEQASFLPIQAGDADADTPPCPRSAAVAGCRGSWDGRGTTGLAGGPCDRCGGRGCRELGRRSEGQQRSGKAAAVSHGPRALLLLIIIHLSHADTGTRVGPVCPGHYQLSRPGRPSGRGACLSSQACVALIPLTRLHCLEPQARQLRAVGRWRPVIGGAILVLVYGALLVLRTGRSRQDSAAVPYTGTAVRLASPTLPPFPLLTKKHRPLLGRVAVVMTGSFAATAVVTALHGPQTIGDMVARIDISTLGLMLGEA